MPGHLVERTDEAAIPAGAEPKALPTFLKFVLAGAVAFVINEAALFLFYDTPALSFLAAEKTRADLLLFTHPDVRLFIASALAVEAAILFKFFVHEHWTFRHRLRQGWIGSRLAGFNASCIVSAAGSVATVNILTPVFNVSPYIATGFGVGAGFIANWVFSAYLVWPHSPEPAAAEGNRF